MLMRHIFKAHVGKSSFKKVSVDGCADELRVGSKVIQLDNVETAIIDCFMRSRYGLTKSELMDQAVIPTISLFNDIYLRLMSKLSEIDIANYGGNGLFYNETIYASELIREDEGRYNFYRPLAKLIGNKPILSDQQLESIKYQPRNHIPMACCR